MRRCCKKGVAEKFEILEEGRRRFRTQVPDLIRKNAEKAKASGVDFKKERRKLVNCSGNK